MTIFKMLGHARHVTKSKLRGLCGCLLLLLPVTLAHASVQDKFQSIRHDTKALYQFLKQWPKGGELHYHLSGSIPPETMLSFAAKGPYCLNTSTFAVTPHTPGCEGVHSKTLTQNRSLYEKTVKAWSLKGFNYDKQTGHDHFYATFPKFTQLVDDHMPQMLADVMKRAEEQHILYAEVMTFYFEPKQRYRQLIAPVSGYPQKRRVLLSDRHYKKSIKRWVERADTLNARAKAVLGCSSSPESDGCHVVIKFQNYVLRESPLDDVFIQALAAFEAAHQSKDIVAVNLVQREDASNSKRDYQEQMTIFNYLHSVYPDVHISLHAGELVSSKQPSHHIRRAIVMGQAERIGHGVDVNVNGDDADLLHYMATKPIPVEINLSSNHRLLNVRGKQHPLSYYIKKQVPIVLSTDDEGILQTDLTHEYMRAVQEHGLDYPTLKTINRNALTYSFLPGESIWKNPLEGQRVRACRKLDSPRCKHFISKSEKARLQWILEKKLRAFEKRF